MCVHGTGTCIPTWVSPQEHAQALVCTQMGAHVCAQVHAHECATCTSRITPTRYNTPPCSCTLPAMHPGTHRPPKQPGDPHPMGTHRRPLAAHWILPHSEEMAPKHPFLCFGAVVAPKELKGWSTVDVGMSGETEAGSRAGSACGVDGNRELQPTLPMDAGIQPPSLLPPSCLPGSGYIHVTQHIPGGQAPGMGG